MSSMYLDTVHAVLDRLQRERLGPIVCGGAYASLFPAHFLHRGVPNVLRLDGEQTLVRLADALRTGGSWQDIPSLSYQAGGRDVHNPVGAIPEDLAACGLPAVHCEDAVWIDHGRLISGDPQRNVLRYEVAASRGCPFTCPYCCCVNLARLLRLQALWKKFLIAWRRLKR